MAYDSEVFFGTCHALALGEASSHQQLEQEDQEGHHWTINSGQTQLQRDQECQKLAE